VRISGSDTTCPELQLSTLKFI